MVLDYGVAPDVLAPGIDQASRDAIGEDCIDLHLEDVQAAQRSARHGALVDRLNTFVGRT